MTEIYLIRHGETENNRLYKFVGSTDQPLNDRGMAQARTLTEPPTPTVFPAAMRSFR